MRIMSDYEKTSVEKVNFVDKIFAFRITTSFFALFLLPLWSLKRHHLPKLPSLHSAFYSCNELGRFFPHSFLFKCLASQIALTVTVRSAAICVMHQGAFQKRTPEHEKKNKIKP